MTIRTLNPTAKIAVTCAVAFSCISQPVLAESNEELAKKLANPIANLISLPVQVNYDQNIGLNDKGSRFTTNVQPVIPVDINEDWIMISRTILPIIQQSDVIGNSSQSGLGDTTQSLFFSPKAPSSGGWIWGVGGAFLLPTGTDEALTTDKWGIGPTAVALKQSGPWTYGGLTNHIVSVAGDSDRADINNTFVQPFVSYTTKAAVSYSLNAEAIYDWENDQLTLPININVSKVMRFGSQLINLGGGVRYYVEGSDTGPEGIAYRLQATWLFPK
ncbi:transporter [Thalassotalea sp. PLHSN55]|uniref:transporter n=1 Tax=Thalassotalea sp. PLHSN55 TaxID=3435888 RepID=UPI003F85BF02